MNANPSGAKKSQGRAGQVTNLGGVVSSWRGVRFTVLIGRCCSRGQRHKGGELRVPGREGEGGEDLGSPGTALRVGPSIGSGLFSCLVRGG